MTRTWTASLAIGWTILGSTAALAETRPEPLRTEILNVQPPPGWVTSVWQGGTLEIAEFTPSGQTGGRHTDLVGYSVLPQIAGVTPTSAGDLPAYVRKVFQQSDCRRQAVLEPQLVSGWYSTLAYCIGRKGSPPDRVELQASIHRVGAQAVFRVWREWRGTRAELAAMRAARGGPGEPVPLTDVGLKAVLTELAPGFLSEIRGAEICDVRVPASCRQLQALLPPEATARARGEFVGGFYGRGMKLLPREEFRRRFNLSGPDDGSPNRVFVVAEPKDLDWSDRDAVGQLLMVVGSGVVSDGGALVATDPDNRLSPEQKAQVRALVVAGSRQLWREGFPPDAVAVRLSPPDAP